MSQRRWLYDDHPQCHGYRRFTEIELYLSRNSHGMHQNKGKHLRNVLLTSDITFCEQSTIIPSDLTYKIIQILHRLKDLIAVQYVNISNMKLQLHYKFEKS